MLVIRNIESTALTTRWPPTPVAANWRSGGRWREESFLHQGLDYEPPWSVISSSSPVVGMVTMSSPQSCPGTQWLSLGNRPETLLRRENTMPPLLFRNGLLIVSLKQNIKRYNWQLSLVNSAGGTVSKSFFFRFYFSIQLQMFLYLLHSFKLYCVKSFQGCSAGILNLTLVSRWPSITYTEDKLVQK